MNIPGSSKKGVYVSLVYKHPEIESIGNYNGFKAYTLRKGLECLKADQTPHPLYENDPGEVLQADSTCNTVPKGKRISSAYWQWIDA